MQVKVTHRVQALVRLDDLQKLQTLLLYPLHFQHVQLDVNQLDVFHRNQSNEQSEKEFLNQSVAPQDDGLELLLQSVA
jgi:hypothetical protein